MTLLSTGIGVSLALLGVALLGLSVRGFARFVRGRDAAQTMWGTGMAMAAAAMFVESVVYLGFVSSLLLQSYVFLSAALVGTLSVGCAHVIRLRGFARAYPTYALAAIAVLGVFSFATPLPLSMVKDGIIADNPPILLLILSSFVTGPATVVLLAASAISLRRARRWQTLMIIAGALILGAGGGFYIASFPVLLYYAEFIGIVLLLAGVVSLPSPSAAPAALGRRSAAGE